MFAKTHPQDMEALELLKKKGVATSQEWFESRPDLDKHDRMRIAGRLKLNGFIEKGPSKKVKRTEPPFTTQWQNTWKVK